ncbi:MAG TPA: hypothetical protein VK364_05935 [Hymenobacter sp.]|nr:hypothetical protein [Hymenobacter sp.]
MATKRKNPQTVVFDSPQGSEADAYDAPILSGTDTVLANKDVDASLCLRCGEPLAWHEEACDALKESLADAEAPEVSVFSIDVTSDLTPAPFAYALGQPVQPAPDARPHTVIWRGQVKKRHQRTGLVHRVNVYKLDNGYWDCYYETELQAA